MIEHYNLFLVAAGLSNFAIAILHVAIIFYGAPGYRYFGAGEKMATMAENGSPFPAAVTLGVTLVFILFGLYAFSGAQIIATLPLLRYGLYAIGAVFSLRSLLVVSELFKILKSDTDVPARNILFSLVSALIGVLYLAGSLRLAE
jgi:hypothetical protein